MVRYCVVCKKDTEFAYAGSVVLPVDNEKRDLLECTVCGLQHMVIGKVPMKFKEHRDETDSEG